MTQDSRRLQERPAGCREPCSSVVLDKEHTANINMADFEDAVGRAGRQIKATSATAPATEQTADSQT